MLLSTPGLVLHTTPYADTSVVARVFTRQLGVRSYIIKGVRSRASRVKQNMLQPLTSLDMVVYDNHRGSINYIRELSPRRPQQPSDPVAIALRMFMTEVLYRALREEEPLQELWDYVDSMSVQGETGTIEQQAGIPTKDIPIVFMLRVAHHLGIEPLDNYSPREPYFNLQEGRYTSSVDDATLPLPLSVLLHEYLSNHPSASSQLKDRTALLNGLISYFQLHLSGFHNFTSHEILHNVLK